MLLLSNAFTSVSLILFFYSIIFVSDAFSAKSPEPRLNNSRNLITLLAIDSFAVYSIVTGQTATGIDVNPTVIMAAAGFGNALYAFS